jgi:hypothetical protein
MRSDKITGIRVWICAATPMTSVVMIVAAGTVSSSREGVQRHLLQAPAVTRPPGGGAIRAALAIATR